MDTDAIKRMHDAAVDLGAGCNSNCYLNPSMCENNAYFAYGAASFTAARAKALQLFASLN